MLIAVTKLIQRRVNKLIKIFNNQILVLPYLMPNLREGSIRKVVFEFYPQPYASGDGNDF